MAAIMVGMESPSMLATTRTVAGAIMPTRKARKSIAMAQKSESMLMVLEFVNVVEGDICD